MAAKKSMQEQANEILQKAEERGVESNFFFLTTFKRYQVQMHILSELEQSIGQEGPMVSKEYVKGRGNLYVNPAITEYNKTSTAANGTVSTLLSIIDKLGSEGEGKSSKLTELLNGLSNE